MPAGKIGRLELTRRGVVAGVAAIALPGVSAAQGAGVDAVRAEIAIGPARAALRPGGAASDLIGVGGAYPPPVLRARKGTPFELTIRNGLGEPVALGIHGLRGPNAVEAFAPLNAAPLAPGEARSLAFTPADAGSFVYMPVLQGRAAEQRERGLAGMLIVDEASPPTVDLEQVAVLDDAALGAGGLDAGQLVDPVSRRIEAARFGRLGNALLVNGALAPLAVTVRPGARVRLRLASVANARLMPMKFQGGRQTVVAIDGQACDPFDPLKRTVVLLPGSRYEVMLDMPAEAGQEAGVFVETGGLHKIIAFRTEGAPLPGRPLVAPLPANDVPPSIRLQNAARAEIAISGGLERPAAGAPSATPDEAALAQRWPDRSKIFQINNGFNAGLGGRPIMSVKRGGPVVLALTNRTAWSQVITVRGHVFRLLHPLDDGWEPYFLDTLHLPPMSTSRIAFDAVNPGRWAIHSTIAEHFDAGVATWFEVQ